ncbi:hypothetical protein LFL96_01185 [Paraburkholderia sp. D15]|uniref:hypothetical protein n=1 Tax=Paraburkholderia sp. D15 TaxID=2880218 RepID=UPI00247A4E21|nr:hypothetical protein [Paraburkholderia sp. D15]WGS50152.1 hypothetical protein LFL96_01185 [Paraburkholderia sp. D15]
MDALVRPLEKYQRRLKSLEHLIEGGVGISKRGEPLPEKELDKTKAFVILAYAETEDFIEGCSLYLIATIEELSVRIKGELKKGKPVSNKQFAGTLKGCFGKLVPSQDRRRKDLLDVCAMKPVVDINAANQAFAFARACLAAKRNEVGKNNGLNKADLSKLFDKLGFDTEENFVNLRNDLDLLTTKRSGFAHTGAGYLVSAAQLLPDPIAERNFVQQLSRGIEEFVTAFSVLPVLE